MTEYEEWPSASASSWSEEGGDVFDLLSRPAWHRDAACRGSDPDVFFPGQGIDPRPAKRICAGCTVREPCLEKYMDERFGIFGGLSERERRKIRKARRRAAA